MEKESRINIEDLPQAERAISQTEASEVRGGEFVRKDVQVSSFQSGASAGSGVPSWQVQGGDDLVIVGLTSQPHVK